MNGVGFFFADQNNPFLVAMVVTLAIAWSKQHDFVASTIIGATAPEQMPDILAAADVVLDEVTLKRINAVSRELLYPMG